jgi:hypothetical protein
LKYAETYPLGMTLVIVSATVPVQSLQPGSGDAEVEHEYAVKPMTTPPPVGVGVGVGDGVGVGVAGFTVKVTFAHDDLPAKSTAQTEKVLLPATVGVPVRVPF